MARASGKSGGRKPNGNGAAANDDGFDQGGPDGPGKQRGEEGHNSRNYDFLQEGIETIEGLEAKCQAIMDKAKAACEPHRTEIKGVKKQLANASFPVAETNAVLRQRKFQRKATDEAITKNFDDEQKDTFAELKKGLGPFADTALGESVLARFKASGGAGAAAAN